MLDVCAGSALAAVAAGAGDGAGAEAAGVGAGAGAAAARRVGSGSGSERVGSGAGVGSATLAGAGACAGAGAGAELTLEEVGVRPCSALTPLPSCRLSRFGSADLPPKNSSLFIAGTAEGAGGKMSDWKESALLGQMKEIGWTILFVTLYARAISFSSALRSRRGRKVSPR